jgi:hypothetical protein
MKTLPIRIDAELVARVREYAKNHELKPSQQRVLELAIKEYLDKKKEEARPLSSTAAVDVRAARSGWKNKGRRCHEGDALHCPVKRHKAS